jgi:hypothetical protein
LAKPSYVLQALNILGLEEILKLSEVLHAKQVSLKKAAGEELIVWNTPAKKPEKKAKKEEAKVLPFPTRAITDYPELEEDAPDHSLAEERAAAENFSENEHVMPSDIILWQRELMKDSDEAIQKLDAMKGYQKSAQMYVVKSHLADGKEKIRFASTNGVLINKKQA